MSYFKPIKNYQLHLIEKCLSEDIKSPFLEVGCGTGEFLLFLESKGFYGMGIDKSKEAIEISKSHNFKNTKIKEKDLFNLNGKFNFILMTDVLEHIKEDDKAIKKIYSLLNKNGYLIFQVPSHKKKYCWIDTSYGHYRRYDKQDIIKILKENNFKIIKLWCTGFPFFSIPERLIGFLGDHIFKSFINKEEKVSERISKSGIISPVKEKIGLTEILFNKMIPLKMWKFLYIFMDQFLNTNKGHTYFVLCKKE